MNNELVRLMTVEQKFKYALNACDNGLDLWSDVFVDNRCPHKFVREVKESLECSEIIHQASIWLYGANFSAITQGNSQPYIAENPNLRPFKYPTTIVMELAYAFSSLQRMLAIAYPQYGFKLDGACEDRCDDSEALSRIASSIVSSVAIAYGHKRGLRVHNKVYKEMLDYGRGLVGE